MNKARRLFTLVAILTMMAACSQAVTAPESAAPSPSPVLATPAPSATTIPTAAITSAPSASPDTAFVLAPDGIGPYTVSAKLPDLEAQGLVANVAPSFNCDETWQHADATGRYAGLLTATFYLGELIDVHTDSAELTTPDGAHVGMPLTELQVVYGSRGTLITGVSGNQALSVRADDTSLGIVFFLDATNTKVRAISAGGVERLEQAVVNGEGC
jgi:hypothetical protein